MYHPQSNFLWVNVSQSNVDDKHRILIDRRLRKKFGIKSGDPIVLIPSGKEIRLIPLKPGETFKGSLDGFNYSSDDHIATELLLKETRKGKNARD